MLHWATLRSANRLQAIVWLAVLVALGAQLAVAQAWLAGLSGSPGETGIGSPAARGGALVPWLYPLLLAACGCGWAGLTCLGWGLAREAGLNSGSEQRRLRRLARVLRPAVQARLEPDEQVLESFTARPPGYDSPVPLVLGLAVACICGCLLAHALPLAAQLVGVGFSQADVDGPHRLAWLLLPTAGLLLVSRLTHRAAAGHLAVSAWMVLVLCSPWSPVPGPWLWLVAEPCGHDDLLCRAFSLNSLLVWQEYGLFSLPVRAAGASSPTAITPALLFWLGLLLWDLAAWRRGRGHVWAVVTHRRLLWFDGSLAGLRSGAWTCVFAGQPAALTMRRGFLGAEVRLETGQGSLTGHFLRARDAARLMGLAPGNRPPARVRPSGPGSAPRAPRLVAAAALGVAVLSAVLGGSSVRTHLATSRLVAQCHESLGRPDSAAGAAAAPTARLGGGYRASQADLARQLAAAEQALALRPRLAYAHALRGAALAGQGRADAARQAFTQALTDLQAHQHGGRGRRLRDYLLTRLADG
ncbi:MAG: hypothetical protein IT204_05480 [Fimbriimonadaceae bacterium]|nr:hypothetical protein [Fimbriimonadaceae bacterium]